LPLGRAQAAELLRRYWRTAVERSLTVAAVREVEVGKGHAELDRRYVVSGTSDERRESVFLGFRRAEGTWQLVEVRRAPRRRGQRGHYRPNVAPCANLRPRL
jgi:hypothetical protein